MVSGPVNRRTTRASAALSAAALQQHAKRGALQGKLLEHIVSFLDVVSLVRAAATSHEFHRACTSDVAWAGSRLEIDAPTNIISYGSSLDKLQHLSFIASTEWTGPFFASVARLPALHTLHKVEQLRPDDIQKLPRLEQLTVRSEELTLELLTTCSQLPQLKSLQVLQICELELTLEELEAALRSLTVRTTVHMQFESSIYHAFPHRQAFLTHTCNWLRVWHHLHSIDLPIAFEPLEHLIDTGKDFFADTPLKDSKLQVLKVSSEAPSGRYDMPYVKGIQLLISHYPNLRNLDLTRQVLLDPYYEDEDEDEEGMRIGRRMSNGRQSRHKRWMN